jgi:hypothetical protein
MAETWPTRMNIDPLNGAQIFSMEALGGYCVSLAGTGEWGHAHWNPARFLPVDLCFISEPARFKNGTAGWPRKEPASSGSAPSKE